MSVLAPYTTEVPRSANKEGRFEFRPSIDANAIMQGGAQRFGISRAAVVEIALRFWADQNRIDYPGKDTAEIAAAPVTPQEPASASLTAETRAEYVPAPQETSE